MPAKKETPPVDTLRIKVQLATPASKLFTSAGPCLHGSVVNLPIAEAEALIGRDQARATSDDVDVIAPDFSIPEPPDAA